MEGIVSNHELQLTLLKLGAPSVLGAPSASLSMPSKASVIATRVSTGGAIFCLCNKLNLDQSQESHCHRHEASGQQQVSTKVSGQDWHSTQEQRQEFGIKKVESWS